MKKAIASHFNGNYLSFYQHYLPNLKREKDNEYKSPCCFHDEKNPSLNINSQTGQFYCFGCGAKGDIFSFYQQRHNLNGNFQHVLKGITNDFSITVESKSKPGKIVATYDYLDTEGNLIHQTVRYEPKDFRQRQQNGNGGYIWNLKGIKPLLYRFPEVLKANEVLIVEGEKDCDNLAKIDFTATTCPMGAGKWREHYNPYLEGKDVVIIPDNDGPGREHMAKVAASLYGKVKSLKVVELPGVPDKGDVSDFISSFDDPKTAAESLSILIENAEPWQPSEKPTGIKGILIDFTNFQKMELPPKKVILDPWITEQSISLISGWRGLGKTWLALSILDAISKGNKFGVWETENSVPVIGQ